MMEFLAWCGEHPFLTVVVVSMVCGTVVRLFRGYPECENCKEEREDQ